jgi:histidyl-tRNA synthetase
MNEQKKNRPKARPVRGLRDRTAGEIAAERAMLDAIRGVYERYGFDPLETPFLEYTDALGKFLPDVDRPNAGVFSFRDDDEQWVSLRYDLTAPLARYVAENQQFLPRPFRRYQIGTVFRNDKPGPGRYREFIQCDADTVGSASPSADAEMVMMFADTLEALGLKRGEYVIKINSRKILDALLFAAQIDAAKRGEVLRAIDKIDRLGVEGVRALLGKGRKDDSGDFTKGAELSASQIDDILKFATPGQSYSQTRSHFMDNRLRSAQSDAAFSELQTIMDIIADSGVDDPPVEMDSSIIRGLDYYTGVVFEAQLKFDVKNDKGQVVEFGSVGGGGRYDDLVARFTGQQTPAVGMSIGVSRLLAALRSRGTISGETVPLTVVTVFDKNDPAPAFAMVRELREAGLRAEAYVGTGKMGDQFKYADKRGAALAIIEGPDERAKGEVTIKDLALGAELAKSVESRAEWTAERQAQTTVKRADLIAEIRKLTRGR